MATLSGGSATVAHLLGLLRELGEHVAKDEENPVEERFRAFLPRLLEECFVPDQGEAPVLTTKVHLVSSAVNVRCFYAVLVGWVAWSLPEGVSFAGFIQSALARQLHTLLLLCSNGLHFGFYENHSQQTFTA